MFVITSLLHLYCIFITLLLQMAKLCNNDFIITHYYVGCVSIIIPLFTAFPLSPIIMISTLFNFRDRATCRCSGPTAICFFASEIPITPGCQLPRLITCWTSASLEQGLSHSIVRCDSSMMELRGQTLRK